MKKKTRSYYNMKKKDYDKVWKRDEELKSEPVKKMSKEYMEKVMKLIKDLLPEFKIKKGELLGTNFRVILKHKDHGNYSWGMVTSQWYELIIDHRCTTEIWLRINHMGDLLYWMFYKLDKPKELKKMRKTILKSFHDDCNSFYCTKIK